MLLLEWKLLYDGLELKLTFSEDPFLTGKMATASTKGVQSEHIGAIINGITANNQQANQEEFVVNLSECTLQEIYRPSYNKTKNFQG